MLSKIRINRLEAFMLPKQIWFLSLAIMINVIGASFLWPLNVIYMRQELDKTLVTASLVMLVMSATGALGNLLGGYLFDKIGGFRTCLIGVATTLFLLVLLNINHAWPAYPLLLPGIGLGQGLVQPALMAMIGTSWPEGGRKAYNVAYVLQNVGVAVGTALGGFVAYYSYDYAFAGYLFFYIIFALMIWFGVRKIKSVKIGKKVNNRQTGQVAVNLRANNLALIFLSIAYMICWVGYIQWQGIIPDYVTKIGITLRQYGMFWTLNGLVIVFLQPPLQFLIHFFRLTIKKQILAGMVFFILSFLLTIYAQTFSVFLLAMGVMTIGEMLIWPAIPTIVNEIAPQKRVGIFQGVVNMAATCGRMVGPLFGATIVTQASVAVLFFLLIMLILLASVFIYLHDRFLKKERAIVER